VGTEEPRPKAEGLLEEVLRRENLMEALKRVRSNRGAPGVDGMTVEALTPYLKEHWPRIREELLGETYVPQLIRRVEIPKPDGKGVRLLGIPTVLDRLIQQSILQVMTPIFDPHDLDKELERRGHRFCRVADDCNVRVKSKAAGERVMESIARYLEKRLRLKINRDKSAVDRPWNRKFLGYTMTSHHRTKLKVSPQSVKRARAHIKEIVRKGRGRSLPKVIGEMTPFLRGWVAYFRRSQVKDVFEELDKWIRRKLRCILWRQWKKPRTRAGKMIRLGIERERAFASARNGHGPWWNAGASHMDAAITAKWLNQRGLTSLLAEHQRLACLA